MDFFGPLLFWGFIIGMVIYKICQACMAHEERQKEENLKYTHPEVYAQLKQMEHEQRLMAHDKERMRQENVKAGAGVVRDIFRIFSK